MGETTRYDRYPQLGLGFRLPTLVYEMASGVAATSVLGPLKLSCSSHDTLQSTLPAPSPECQSYVP